MEQTKIILIVEDDKTLRDSLQEGLMRSGFSAISAENGEDGLKLSLEKHPDLILLDLVMPKMNGMTMLRKLREDTWGKTVPVIILTNLSSADEERNKDIAELEPTYYFVKTDKSLEEIFATIKARLGMP